MKVLKVALKSQNLLVYRSKGTAKISKLLGFCPAVNHPTPFSCLSIKELSKDCYMLPKNNFAIPDNTFP